MLQEETLKEKRNGEYDEPDGEIIEVLSDSRNSITLLTRVEFEKAAAEEDDSPLFDPNELSVSDLRDTLDGEDFTEEEYAALLEAEKGRSNRKTAKAAIENYL
jgi:hypothetical protein